MEYREIGKTGCMGSVSGKCEKRCPFQVFIMKNMTMADNLLNSCFRKEPVQ